VLPSEHRSIFVAVWGLLLIPDNFSKKTMRKYSVFLFLMAFVMPLFGQLPNGSIAPDFNVPDINGQPRHLYEILSEGKIVMLEVSATWCPPCWAYHNGHALQNFYNLHGPLGDNRARVLFIEGDPTTNVACLYGPSGCNNTTAGDWISGTTYPYIDNSTVAEAYQVAYFPTIYVICPNKKVYNVGQLDAIGLWEKAMGCPVKQGSNNAGIFEYTPGTPLYEICDTMIMAPQFTLINLGAQALSSATIQLQWENATIETLQWTGNLNTYGEAPIHFNPHPFSGAGSLKTTVSSINAGVPDEDFSNNVRNNAFVVAKDFNSQKVLLKIRTDGYGNETYWELRDDNGNVLDHGGNELIGPNGGGLLGDPPISPTAYGNNVLIRDTLELPSNGCYSLHFVDFYGDGFCCGFGNGYYKLYNLDNPVVPIISGGEFGAYEDRSIGIPGVSSAANTPSASSFGLQLFPNPATNQVRLYFDLPIAAQTRVIVTDLLGKVVYKPAPFEAEAGEVQLDIPLNQYAPGLYLLHLQIEKQQISRAFSIVRE